MSRPRKPLLERITETMLEFSSADIETAIWALSRPLPEPTEESMARFVNTNELIESAEKQGWRSRQTTRGVILYPPNKDMAPVVCSQNNTSSRDVQNCLSWLRRSGFDPNFTEKGEPTFSAGQPEKPAAIEPAPTNINEDNGMSSIVIKQRYIVEDALCELQHFQVEEAILDWVQKHTGQRPPKETKVKLRIAVSTFELNQGDKAELSWQLKREA